MKLGINEIMRMIDLSVLRPEDTEQEVRQMVNTAREHRCAAVFALPAWTSLVVDLLEGDRDVAVGAAVGFPFGGQTTRTKVAETKELLETGCTEFDMVINIGKLISGRRLEVLDDIRAVVDAARGFTVKVILECHYLSEDQIRTGCDLCIEAGASWVKTGTGLAPTGATLENVTIIKRRVGDAIGVKASGGIRGLVTMMEMYRRGARRFGLSLKGAMTILEMMKSIPSQTVDL